jgi:peptidoglycan/xylan/chitin deacetylase (PgdA/CDA1 family)
MHLFGVVLYYHSIPDSARSQFAAQLDTLARRATVVCSDWRGASNTRLHCAITFDDAFQNVLTNALPELAKRQLHCTIFVPVGSMGQIPAWSMETDCDANEVVASADFIKALPRSLVTIGAHTISHPFLSRIPRGIARREIELSRAILSEIVGYPVCLMSFPYGDYDQAVAEMCKKAGYHLVFGIEPQAVDPLDSEFIRGRIAVDPTDGPLEFFLKMNGAYRWMPVASNVKQALVGAISSAWSTTTNLRGFRKSYNQTGGS